MSWEKWVLIALMVRSAAANIATYTVSRPPAYAMPARMAGEPLDRYVEVLREFVLAATPRPRSGYRLLLSLCMSAALIALVVFA